MEQIGYRVQATLCPGCYPQQKVRAWDQVAYLYDYDAEAKCDRCGVLLKVAAEYRARASKEQA